MLETALTNIRIVLVEPAGPLNVGSVARIMKNMDLHQLVLVNPQCDYLGEEARLMAVRAAEILETARVVETLPAALVGCTRAIATTGVDRSLPVQLEEPAAALPWLLEAPSALIFGRENNGLTNAELNYAQRSIRIPSSDAYNSLNLAQAAAICCYEIYQARSKKEEGERGRVGEGENGRVGELTIPNSQFPIPNSQLSTLNSQLSCAPLENLEGYYRQLETLLLKIGYLHPHTAASRMEKFRYLYNRAYPTVDEVAMLRGILRQVEWAIELRSIAPVSDTVDGALPDIPSETEKPS
ncbi:MAG: RNA methyltransferase [Richelia sp. CSU_2_1]|nr:RNA methyltransferase [Richelia sp. CSU_2_1]